MVLLFFLTLQWVGLEMSDRQFILLFRRENVLFTTQSSLDGIIVWVRRKVEPKGLEYGGKFWLTCEKHCAENITFLVIYSFLNRGKSLQCACRHVLLFSHPSERLIVAQSISFWHYLVVEHSSSICFLSFSLPRNPQTPWLAIWVFTLKASALT